jgi:hypothetical protein
MSRFYPEIEAMTKLKDVEATLRMGYNCLDSVNDEFKPDLESRLRALELRREQLKVSA